jgi:hypothetical protein
MYDGIRLSIFTVIFLAVWLIISKSSRANKKRKTRIAFIVCVIFALLSTLVPLENQLIAFHSAETAFKYNRKGDINAVIGGKRSAMILYSDTKTSAPTIYPRTERGYNLDVYPRFSTENYSAKSKEKSDELYNIVIYHVKKTSDFYLMIWKSFSTNTIEISDNYSSEFICIEEGEKDGSKYFQYYAYVENLSLNDYEILINGAKYTYQDFL